MEDQRQYCLKWNNHPTNISLVFDRLRMEELFVDVTLATQDRQIIRAHRVLLSAGSGYLEKVLAMNPSDHPTVVLSNIRYKELKLLVDFMYSGEIAVDQQQFPVLLEAAKSLRIRGLYEPDDTLFDDENSKEPKQKCGINNDKPESELCVKSSPISPKIVKDDNTSTATRKRSHSIESEEEEIKSPESVKVEDEISVTEETPSKLFKTMYGPLQGVSNPFWMMSQDLQSSEKSPDVSKNISTADVPNLMNLVTHQANLMQNDNRQAEKETQNNAQKILQAMQMCTNPYFNNLASMQKPLDLLTSNFTPSFNQGISPSNNTTKCSPNSKAGLLNSAPVRRYKQYSEDSLQAALKEIMNGQSINRSSMKHNIPARTLRDWMKRLNIKSVFTHHSHNKERTNSHDATDRESSTSESPEPRSLDMTSPVFGAGVSFPVNQSPHSGSVFPGMKINGVKEEDEIDDDEPKALRIDENPLGSLTQIAQEAN